MISTSDRWSERVRMGLTPLVVPPSLVIYLPDSPSSLLLKTREKKKKEPPYSILEKKGKMGGDGGRM